MLQSSDFRVVGGQGSIFAQNLVGSCELSDIKTNLACSIVSETKCEIWCFISFCKIV